MAKEGKRREGMAQKEVLYADLDTPAILVDLDKMEANISRMADMTAKAGLKVRPHTKAHKGTYVVELQLKAGAVGVSVSKVSEAAVYVNAGIGGIMIVHPFYGDQKFAAFKNLFERAEIACVVDNMQQVEGLCQVGLAVGRKVPVLLKIFTNLKRFGVAAGEPILRMAKEIRQMTGVELVGIMSHASGITALSEAPAPSLEVIDRLACEEAGVTSATARMLRKEGFEIQHVAAGATPSARALCKLAPYFPEITEIHPGAYFIGDWMYVNALAMTEDQCAGTILVTVISQPTKYRACIDGGSKTFSADPNYFTRIYARPGDGPWKPTFGTVKGRPDIQLTGIPEEIGMLTLSDPNRGVDVGERLEILPNHISLAINLKDKIYGVRNGKVEREIPVLCRGMDQ